LIYRVLRNASFCFPEIVFKFNGKKVAGKALKGFMDQIHPINEFNENGKVRLGVFCSEGGFQHLSFVNGLETVRGGTHLDYVTDWICIHLKEFLLKKHKIEVKPADIKNNLFVMLNFRLPAPDFDGQTKERLINPAKEWNDRFKGIFTEKFIRQLTKNPEIMQPIIDLFQAKADAKEKSDLRKAGGAKTKTIRVEKYLPATKRRKYLVLTEGDSAKGGISGALGRDFFSYFPLRGKPLNAYEATVKKILENKEINSVVKISGMRLDKDDQKEFRYENILIATDQDADGIHIRALLLSFYSRFSPSLLKQGRIQILQTPLVVAKKNKKIKSYYFTLGEYQKAEAAGKLKGCQITYYKGLGTWDAKDLKGIIAKEGIEKFIVPLEWTKESEQSIIDWVGSKTEARKVFLRDKSFSLEAI
jgi:DNA topoisomerase-2